MCYQEIAANGIGPALPGFSPRELIEARDELQTFYTIVERDSGQPALLSLDTKEGVVVVDTGSENVPGFQSKRTAQRRMKALRDEMNEGYPPSPSDYVRPEELRVVPVEGKAIPGAMYG